MLNWLGFGHFAVSVFILLSGFCLTLPIVLGDGKLRGGPLRFLIKRGRRILPPYYAALIFSLVLIHFLIGPPGNGSHWDVSIPVTQDGLIANLLLLQDLQGKFQINHAFWSIAVEWKIYFLFPLLVILSRRLSMWTVSAVTFALAFAASAIFHGGRFEGMTVHYIGVFAVGMLAAKLAMRPQAPPRWFVTALPMAAGLTLFIALTEWGLAAVAHHLILCDCLVALIFAACLVIWARSPHSPTARLLSSKPLVWIGGFSYSIYLLHAPLIQVAYRYVLLPSRICGGWGVLLLGGAAVPLVIAVSYGFHLIFEKPFMTRRLQPASPSAHFPEYRPSITPLHPTF
jgi:peptidoglycan/LPS O-acetylase OafA/YrhL